MYLNRHYALAAINVSEGEILNWSHPRHACTHGTATP